MVGNADKACFQAPKSIPYSDPVINDKYIAEHLLWPQGPKTQRSIDRANKQLEGLVDLLKAEGVHVIRPEVIDWSKPISTPFWSVYTQYCSTCPRDSLITCGNVIVESAMARRDRFFEFTAYRKAVETLWKTDKNCFWKQAPKNALEDSMYNFRWLEMTNEERAEAEKSKDQAFSIYPDKHVIFDAADFTRTGKHIFGHVSITTNLQGIEWLDRELKPYGFHVHPARFHNDLYPSHIDSTFVPLRKGLVLANPERPLWEDDIQMFYENDWEIVYAPEPIRQDKPMFSQSSRWLSINLLNISPDKLVIEQEETGLKALLEDHGFEVLTLPYRDVYEFGGGFHCSTWDINRDDSQMDLFPKWVPKSFYRKDEE